MDNIGTEHFEMSLELKGLEHRIAQHFMDYTGEIEKTVSKYTKALIENFDLEKEIKLQIEIQYKKLIGQEVGRLLMLNQSEITKKANSIIQETQDPTEKQTPEAGSICTKCNEGRVALALSTITCADMDDEPYEDGIHEGNNELITLDECITFVLYICDYCGHVHSINRE